MAISDELMIYDNHRYQLTKQSAEKILGGSLTEYFSTEKEGLLVLGENSDKIYEHLMTYRTFREIEYLIGTNDYYRDIIYQALKNQLRYAIRSAGDMTGDVVKVADRTMATLTESERNQMMLSSSVYKVLSIFRHSYDFTVSDDEWRVGY